MHKRTAAAGLAIAIALVSSSALAVPEGVPGYTGKPNATAPQGESCSTNCHTGGAAPTVTINGPNSLDAGQAAEYTLVVQTGLARAGAGVAATDGVALVPLANFRDSFGEMVHANPVVVSGGQATFRFRVTAPTVGTAIKLWGVGLGANNDSNPSGDRAAQTTKDITIVGGQPAPGDAGSSTSSSGGTGSSSGSTSSGGDAGKTSSSSSGDAGGTSSSGGSSSGSGAGAAPGDDDDDSVGGGQRRVADSDTSSCSAGPAGSSANAGVVLALAIAAAVGARRRARSGRGDRFDPPTVQ